MASIALQRVPALVYDKSWARRIWAGLVSIAIFSSVGITWNGISSGTSDAKYFYFALATTLVLLLFSGYAIYRGKSASLKIGLIDICLLLFTFYIVISNVAFEKSTGFQSINYTTLLAAYFLLKGILQTENQSRYIQICIGVFLCVATLEACYGIAQLTGISDSASSLFAVTGSFHNPGPFGIYLSAPLVLAVAVLLNKSANGFVTNKLLKILAAVTIAATASILPFTASRTAWISSFAGIAYLLYNFYAHRKATVFADTNLRRISWGILIAGILVCAGIALYQFKPASASGRVLIWTVAAPMVLKNPLWGLGPNGFQNYYGDYQSAYFSDHPVSADKAMIADQVPFAYNDYLQIWIEYGFVGLLLLLGVLISAWRNGSLAGKCLLITCIIGSATSYALQGLPTSLNLYFAVLICGIPQKNVWRISIKGSRWAGIFAFGFSIFLLTSTITLINYKAATSRAQKLFNDGRYSESITEYQSLGPQLSRDLRSLSYYGKALAINNRHLEAVRIYEKALTIGSEFYLVVNLAKSYQEIGNLRKAENMYLYAIRMIPNRLYSKYLLAKLYADLGESVKAKAMAQKVVGMREKVPSLATREMKEHMRVYLDSYK